MIHTTESFKTGCYRSGKPVLAHPFMSLPFRSQGNVPKIFNMSKFNYYLSKYIGAKNPFTYKPKNEGGCTKKLFRFLIFFLFSLVLFLFDCELSSMGYPALLKADAGFSHKKTALELTNFLLR